MDVSARFRTIVRRLVGLPDDPGQPPRIDRLALYRATVQAAASDGSTLDVSPEDPRVPPMQKIPVRVGIPGAVAVVQQGAVVLVGWERGDPQRPYCVPSWESGATVSELDLPATVVYLGAKTGSDFVALAQSVLTQLQSIQAQLTAHTHGGVTTGAGTSGPSNSTYVAGSVAATQVKAK